MQINKTMAELLQANELELTEIAPVYHFPIWQKMDATGRPYWGAGHFHSMDRYGNLEERNLSQLEWDANELGFSTNSHERVADLLRDAIGIMMAWREMLVSGYPDTEFCILASYDDGQAMWEEDEEHGCEYLSVAFRFWATRGNHDVVNLENFDEWKQPAALIVCNCRNE